MSERERYASWLLDHRYGLLEPEQVRELEAYFASGAEGAALKVQADAWTERLAAASKGEFADVRFTAPMTTPMRLPSHATPSKRAPWFVAASLLILGLGLGVPFAREAYLDAKSAREVTAAKSAYEKAEANRKALVEARAAELARLETVAKGAMTFQEQLTARADEALTKLQKSIQDRRMTVRLTGPAQAQAGALNEWRIDTLKRDQMPAHPLTLEFVVKDGKGTPLYTETRKAPTDEGFREPQTLSLPVSFWDKTAPESDLQLEVAAYDRLNARSVLCEQVSLARPTFVTHLATDKPMYKPGETLYFRSLTLDRTRFTPPDRDMQLEFRLTKPDGSVSTIASGVSQLTRDAAGGLPLLGPDQKPLRGIGCGEHILAANDTPGGEYTLSVVERTPEGAETVLEKRKFIVNEYLAETFFKKLEFDGKSYGAGDIVNVRTDVSRTAGGVLKNARVIANATIDGKPVPVRSSGTTDEQGVARLQFTVPNDITDGIGSLSVTFQDADAAEAIVRPIPLVGKRLSLEFFPEGGEIVAGTENRVYIQAKTPLGKPADFVGELTDGTDTVCEVRINTDANLPGVNRGHGAFTFTPKAGVTYFVRVKKPLGIVAPNEKGFELPKVKPEGVVLRLASGMTRADEPLVVNVTSMGKARALLVGAYVRGRFMGQERVSLAAGATQEVKIVSKAAFGGVVRVTAFEEIPAVDGGRARLEPVAERLTYRAPAEQLLLNVSPDKSRYNPGSKVKLDVTAHNEAEKSVAAVLMVAVVNQSILTMADEKTGRLMPTHFLLAGEVQKPEDLEHADFLLTEDRALQPKAVTALDLLLGVQGWRRFVEQQGPPIEGKQREDVERLMVASGQKTLPPLDATGLELGRLRDEYRPQLEVAQAKTADAQKAFLTASDDPNAAAAQGSAESAVLATAKAYQEQARTLDANRAMASARLAWLGGAFQGVMVVGAIVLFGMALVRHGRMAAPYFASGLACVGLGGWALATTLLPAGKNAVLEGREVADRLVKPVNPEMGDLARPTDDNMPLGLEWAEIRQKALVGQLRFAEGEGRAAGDPQKQWKMAGGGIGAKPMKGMAVPPMVAMPEMAPRVVMEAPAPVVQMAPAAPMEKAKFDDGRRQMGVVAAGKPMPGAMALRPDGAKMAAAREPMMRDADKRMDENGMLKDLRRERALAPGDQARKQLQNAFQDRMIVKEAQMGKGEFKKQAMHDKELLDPEMQLGQAIPVSVPFFVREYAHQTRRDKGGVRDDFAETVSWHPVLVLPNTGKASIEFDLADDVARYSVLVAGHTLDGRIGATTLTTEARKSFTVDPKLPLEVTAGDRIDLPVRIVNDSDLRRTITVGIETTGLTPIAGAAKWQDSVILGADGKTSRIVGYRPLAGATTANVVVKSVSDPMEGADDITRTLKIVPEGFPMSGASSDLLEKSAQVKLNLPKNIVPGTLQVKLNLYPTTLADLQSGLEGLLQEPGGCFEQTSTSNYPNLLILDYLKTADQPKPELTAKAKGMLDRGYKKLVAFECPNTPTKDRQGFEWFGSSDNQHEALTAYGLLQFKDLSRVHPVDPELIARTQKYLLSRRDGKGGYTRNAGAADSFGRAPASVTNAYITWALVESDPSDSEKLPLEVELAAMKKAGEQAITDGKDDPYELALMANALLRRPANGNREAAVKFLERIVAKHMKEGHVIGAKTSITCSGGSELEIETTALALLGWLRSGEQAKFAMVIKDATKWIGAQRGGYGGFGGTQSTVLALKALIEHAIANKKPAEDGIVTLKIAGRTFEKKFTKADLETIAITIDKPEEFLKEGVTEAELTLTTKAAYPFALTWNCSTRQPASAENCPVDFKAELARKTLTEGETTQVNITLTNVNATPTGMATAIIGLPGGCRLPADLKQITDLREKGRVSYFEVRGREVILYWRALDKNQVMNLSIDVVAEVPGEYRGPASRAYLYYNADVKKWLEPLALTITPATPQAKADAAE